MKNRENDSCNTKETKPVIFLNLPIDSSSKDVIGLGSYADNLSQAIDNGAQTIAVTSTFGMGKTSVVELLREKRSNKKNEQILKVPMWMQLTNTDDSNDVITLHRNFVYQIASQISHQRGTYVSRRLSPNYRLLKIHANKPRYWLMMVFALVFFTVAWAINSFHDQIAQWIPSIASSADSISIAAIVLAVVLGIISITRSEIIISTGRAESDRQIESDEIIELYYSEILKYRYLPHWISKCIFFKNFYKHYIVIIEDLDRSNHSEAVKSFLKEIRKYYIPDTANSKYKYRNTK